MKQKDKPAVIFEQIGSIENQYINGMRMIPEEELMAVVLSAMPEAGYAPVLMTEQRIRGNDKICMMTTRRACNQAIESSYWRMDNDSDVGLLTGYVLYWLPVELEFMDLDIFPRSFGLRPSLHTS
jgi:hypothetical protein